MNTMNTFKFDFDVDKNKYILKINEKTFELTREEAVNIHNTMNKTLKATPQLFNLKEQK
ncbi:hypothetical protein [Aliarcobacter skirrowii]|uniref:hypothetical protein n=1 Tax=Aliarcobacter skirrowii TaxID=28200 RepID=UPI0029B6C648|nr:hypothetical protein [Aliarcobacter skirrowii]MDX4028349.1 hypothetical protein [Aliarcobacter skirrowii]